MLHEDAESALEPARVDAVRLSGGASSIGGGCVPVDDTGAFPGNVYDAGTVITDPNAID